MRILFDSKKTEHKTPFGCVRQNQLCSLTVHIPSNCKVTKAEVVFEREDNFKLVVPAKKTGEKNDYEFYNFTFSLFETGLYFYYFIITTESGQFRLFKQGNDTNMEAGDKWQLTCFAADYYSPKEFCGAVMYQIFPDRFAKTGTCDLTDKLTPFEVHSNLKDVPVFYCNQNGDIVNNDFYGGNLKGIINQLDYLKSLCVSVIYLNPIFMAFSNHRYDTADYKRIDPMLGNEKDFRNLCEKAHAKGIKIILDGVFSHTGDNSVYFDRFYKFGNGAISGGENSPYREWYDFSDYPNEYTSWWGIKSLPCVKEMTESYVEFIITGEDSVVKHWMRLGADGFRLDVADELPDEFIRLLHQEVKRINPEGMVIGEVWEDASNKISYGVRRKYFVDSELDSVMNYPFKNAIIDFAMGKINADRLADITMTIAENYPAPVVACLMNSLSTHDTPRVLTVLGEPDFNMSKEQKAYYSLSRDMLKKAEEREKIAAFLQYSLPGMPCIYYGDEIGMQGFEDPLNRAFFDSTDVNASLLSFYRRLGLLKSSNDVLKYGDFYAKSQDNCFVAERSYNGEKLCIFANSADTTFETNLKGEPLFLHNAEKTGETLRVFAGGSAIIRK